MIIPIKKLIPAVCPHTLENVEKMLIRYEDGDDLDETDPESIEYFDYVIKLFDEIRVDYFTDDNTDDVYVSIFEDSVYEPRVLNETGKRLEHILCLAE